jgi:WD40 repeat protein
LASGGTDRNIRLWDVDTHTIAAVLTGHTNTVRCVSFSPDGHTLASGSEDTTVQLWDVASRSCTGTLTERTCNVCCVTFYPKVLALLILSHLSDRGWVLQLIHWSREEHHLFPVEFRVAVRQVVCGQHAPASILNTLPMDVLELVIRELARVW